MAIEHEQYAANVADVSAITQFHTSIADPAPNDAPCNAPINARVFPKALREYQSADIKGIKREGQVVKFVKKGKGIKIGAGGQSCIYEVVVDTGVEHGGRNPRYQTYAAKVFKGPPNDNRYGQWQEQVHGLAEYYGSFICHFYGYCRNYEAFEGVDEDSEEGFAEGSKKGSETAFETASETGSEKGSFCLLMRKYDCSLRDVIDEEMRKNNNSGRPFIPGVAVNMICQIAAGMAIVHKENIIHRDLKADNVFVYIDADDNMPWGAYIGDFDISDTVQGTTFWRAPEILEAVHREETPSWTPMADVYSFGMTCYESLTGAIPLRHPLRCLKFTDYESVYKAGIRPVLPADLNPKLKQLIVRCWHQDPLQRPTFDAIVLELKEMLHEFPVFLKMFDQMGKLPPSKARPSTEECLSRLEHIFQEFRSKYPVRLFVRLKEVDFIKRGFHFLKCMKRFIRQFGSKPYIDHPSLPWSLYYARTKWMEKLRRFSIEMDHALPYFEDRKVITTLTFYIFDAICEGQEVGDSWTEEEGIDEPQREAKWGSWLENVRKRPPLVDRHFGCIQKSNYGHYGGDKDYPICGFCQEKKPGIENAQNPTFRLFDKKFASNAWNIFGLLS